MEKNRFPYEKSDFVSNNAQHAKEWFEALEHMGPANVRARLAQDDAGSRGAMSIGIVPSRVDGVLIPRGFVLISSCECPI